MVLCFIIRENIEGLKQENQELQRKLDLKEREVKHLHGVIRNLKGKGTKVAVFINCNYKLITLTIQCALLY